MVTSLPLNFGPGTNYFTRSDINDTILVYAKNASEYAMYAINDTDSSVPTDAGMVGQGCFLIINATGFLYINTAIDGAAATFVQIGTAPTVLAGDVVGPVGTNLVASIQGIPPVSVSVADELYTTVGGASTEVITLAGILATDRVQVTLKDKGSNSVTVLNAHAGVGSASVEFSVDPGNDAIINLLVTRSTGL